MQSILRMLAHHEEPGLAAPCARESLLVCRMSREIRSNHVVARWSGWSPGDAEAAQHFSHSRPGRIGCVRAASTVHGGPAAPPQNAHVLPAALDAEWAAARGRVLGPPLPLQVLSIHDPSL